MTTTLVLTNDLLTELRDAAGQDEESGAVVIAKLIQTTGANRRLVAQTIHWVPDGAYSVREKLRLEVLSEGYVPALQQAAEEKAVAIWVHTHPRNYDPTPSTADNTVDGDLADTFRIRTRSGFYGQLIVSIVDSATTFSGF
jgi:proteasome lid subunit RPN8/RPN11